MLFLFACILLIGVKYWLHKNEENNHPLNAEANYAESGGNASDEKKEELQHEVLIRKSSRNVNS